MLAGKTLDRLEAAEQIAEKGEVVLDEPTWASVAPVAQQNGWRTSNGARYALVTALTTTIAPKPWLPLAADALAEAQVRPWVLAPVYDRLIRGQSRFLAELRPAVGLFMNFSGIEYDNDEHAGEKTGYLCPACPANR